MLSRRTVVAALALVGLGIAAAAAGAPLVRGGAGDGLFLGRGGPERPLGWSRALLVPQDNGNTRYQLSFDVRRFDDDDEVYLRRGALLLRSSSHGGDDTRWTVSFELDRATAAALAPWLGIPRPERRPLGQGLVATFANPAGTTIRLTLRNGGTEPVGVTLGGRNRGPRNNQFSFEVTRDGVRVPPIEGWDFGGLATVRPLAPGDEVSVEEDAARWAAFDQPGRYVVRCRYEAELVADKDLRRWPGERIEVWDGAWEGELVLER